VVLWVVMLVSGCFRFDRSWPDSVGILIGVVWILELIGLAVISGLSGS
jgi:hypothetical protein